MAETSFNPREDARHPVLKAKIEAHWAEFRPNQLEKLSQSGQLERALDQTAADTVLELHRLQNAGLAPDQAKELAYEIWNQPESDRIAENEG